MRKIHTDLKEKFLRAVAETKEFLMSPDKISAKDTKLIIKRYVAAIEGNFVAWMAGASISARSVVSKFAADENLWVELKDDHPGMLRNFAKCANAEPDGKDFEAVEKEVARIRNLVGELSGIKNVALMAVLENTSAAFIPYLAELAKKLGSEDLTYTDIHGEADIEHANQFLEALSDEKTLGYPNAEKDIEETIGLAIELIRKIFTV